MNVFTASVEKLREEKDILRNRIADLEIALGDEAAINHTGFDEVVSEIEALYERLNMLDDLIEKRIQDEGELEYLYAV